MKNEIEIAAHREMRQRLLKEVDTWPIWMLSYDVRNELRAAEIIGENK